MRISSWDVQNWLMSAGIFVFMCMCAMIFAVLLAKALTHIKQPEEKTIPVITQAQHPASISRHADHHLKVGEALREIANTFDKHMILHEEQENGKRN